MASISGNGHADQGCPVRSVLSHFQKYGTKDDAFRIIRARSARDVRSVGRAVHTGWWLVAGGDGKRDSGMPRQRDDTAQPEEVAAAARSVFQTIADLCYERSNDEADGLAVSMFLFENMALHSM
eukprot:365542-Chlamydomonas_euryale.AAC.1